jgi:hypothetical protein
MFVDNLLALRHGPHKSIGQSTTNLSHYSQVGFSNCSAAIAACKRLLFALIPP